MKTKDEIDYLKATWQNDPLWDIENTPGFEEYHDELLTFRQKVEERWAKESAYREKRSTKYNLDCAITNLNNAEKVHDSWTADNLLQSAIVFSLLAIASELKRANDLKE